jgi:hypothetical protein
VESEKTAIIIMQPKTMIRTRVRDNQIRSLIPSGQHQTARYASESGLNDIYGKANVLSVKVNPCPSFIQDCQDLGMMDFHTFV